MVFVRNIVEPVGAGHWISGQYDANQSGEEITLAATTVALPSGTMLGKVATGAVTATVGAVVAAAGGTPGNATYGSITMDAGAQLGRWWIEYVDATHFNVLRPDGTIEGSGVLGSAYNGEMNIPTPAAGATPHVEDDRVPVDVAAAAGSGHYKPIDPAATDGSQNWAGTLYEGRPAKSGGTQKAVGVVRGPVVGNLNLVSFVISLTTDQKNVVIAQAKAAGVVFRK